MNNNQKNSVFILTCFSIALWLLSLAFNGLVLGTQAYNKVVGLEILAMGWLSPLFLNFAWFANIFFFKAGWSLLTNKRAVTSAVIASILSIDMFRMSRYLINEGGTTVVYGYGWGAVLWMLSIFLMLAAACKKSENDPKEKDDYTLGLKLKKYGLAPFGIAVLLTGYFSIHDRWTANETELGYLSKVAFKRGKVCTAVESPKIDPIKGFSGTLDVHFKGVDGGYIYPFSQAKYIVDWGVPEVIVNEGSGAGIYGYASNKDNTKSRAILYVQKAKSGTINLKMVEEKSNRIVFDFTWESWDTKRDSIFCPEYHSIPQSDEQPRKMIMEALGLSKS